MRAFVVRLPSGQQYWTVLDEELKPVAEADRFLRHVRFGRDGSELTTRSYAGGLALYFRWCERTGRDWRTAAAELGLFIVWLRYAPVEVTGVRQESAAGVAWPGPGARPVRSERRVNGVLAGVRGFLTHAVMAGDAPAGVLSQVYELADDRDLPAAARGEDQRMAWRLRARHRLREPQRAVDRASDQEIVALLKACRSARDRLVVLLMARAGLRRGEMTGLRRADIHFLPDSSALGCGVQGAHVHVIRRDNPNGAWAKSRRQRYVPADFLLVRAYDQYVLERETVDAAAGSDFVLVNLFRPPAGAPLRADAVNEVVTGLCRRARLSRRVTPHQLRHAFGSNLADAGGAIDEIAELLGHASMSSTQVYLHPDPGRLRAAVERVPSPRGWPVPV